MSDMDVVETNENDEYTRETTSVNTQTYAKQGTDGYYNIFIYIY